MDEEFKNHIRDTEALFSGNVTFKDDIACEEGESAVGFCRKCLLAFREMMEGKYVLQVYHSLYCHENPVLRTATRGVVKMVLAHIIARREGSRRAEVNTDKIKREQYLQQKSDPSVRTSVTPRENE